MSVTVRWCCWADNNINKGRGTHGYSRALLSVQHARMDLHGANGADEHVDTLQVGGVAGLPEGDQHVGCHLRQRDHLTISQLWEVSAHACLPQQVNNLKTPGL